MVDHPRMTQGILSKTGMEYRGTSDNLVRAQRCTHGVNKLSLVAALDCSKLSVGAALGP